jgi:hypothetical protein
MNARVVVALSAFAAALSLTRAVAQDDEEADNEPVRCLSMSSIRSTKIVDDSTVLFFHGRGRIYVNRLDRECVGLLRNGRFTYQVQSGARHTRLCATDSITVLESTGRGFNCGLGMFEPIESEKSLEPRSRAVTSTQVELPPAEPAAPAPTAEPAPR